MKLKLTQNGKFIFIQRKFVILNIYLFEIYKYSTISQGLKGYEWNVWKVEILEMCALTFQRQSGIRDDGKHLYV